MAGQTCRVGSGIARGRVLTGNSKHLCPRASHEDREPHACAHRTPHQSEATHTVAYTQKACHAGKKDPGSTTFQSVINYLCSCLSPVTLPRQVETPAAPFPVKCNVGPVGPATFRSLRAGHVSYICPGCLENKKCEALFQVSSCETELLQLFE